MENLKRLRTSILMATQYRIKEESTDFMGKVSALSGDLRNVPSHVFGVHKQCSALGYYKRSWKDKEKNLIPEMVDCGLYQDIETCLHRLIYNAPSLINNMNNNIAEQYNSVVCKFVAGKRVNFIKRVLSSKV